MSIKGIDVSHWQGHIDWSKVVTAFAYLKATEGEAYHDPKFKHNWLGAQTAHIPVGAYHFFHPDQDAGIQAKHFCDALVSVTGDRLPPVLDIEQTGGISQSLMFIKIAKWLNLVEDMTGQKPIIYTYSAFAKQVRLSKRFGDYPLWMAHYRVIKPNLAGWAQWLMWQYNDKGKVAGIQGNVDTNYYHGTLASLKALVS